MKIIEQNTGKKISYQITGNEIRFADDLQINLERYEQDDTYTLFVYADRAGCLMTTISPDFRYVAQITIPPRQYKAREKAVYEDDMPVVPAYPVPFDIANCTLALWAVE